MASRFSQYISTTREVTPRLPLTHTTDVLGFRGILEEGQIEIGEPNSSNERLIFFFYDRPAYRPDSLPNGYQGPTLPFMPCSIVLRDNAVATSKRIYSFDSWAYDEGRLQLYIHPKMKIEDFQIEPSMGMPPRLVEMFYGSNDKYYSGEPKIMAIPPAESEVQCYYSIINHRATPGLDDRSSAIEIQTDQLRHGFFRLISCRASSPPLS